MKVWITKYALSSGIFDVEVNISTVSANMVATKQHDCFHGEGREWHRTPEAAAARAEVMRKAKIKSLEKQITKLRAMSFGAPR